MKNLQKKCIFIILFITACINNVKSQNYFYTENQYDVANNEKGSITNVQFEEAFNTVLKFGIPFKYSQGGCESRAYAMYLLLDSMHIPNFRIWIFAPSKYLQNNYDLLHVKDRNDPTKTINWGYHTAPAVVIKEKDKLDTFILDPSLSKKPLIYKDWLLLMDGYNIAYYTFISSDFFMFYTTPISDNKNKIDFFKYEGIAKGLNYGDMKLEKNLALDYVGRYLYGKYIKNDESKKIDYIKPIISSIANLENFILGNKLPDEIDISLRQLYNEFPDFVKDSKNVYNREFYKWYRKINAYQKKGN